jgi:hypothetical protein
MLTRHPNQKDPTADDDNEPRPGPKKWNRRAKPDPPAEEDSSQAQIHW